MRVLTGAEKTIRAAVCAKVLVADPNTMSSGKTAPNRLFIILFVAFIVCNFDGFAFIN